MHIELPADVLVIISSPHLGYPFAPWIHPQFSVTDWQKPSVKNCPTTVQSRQASPTLHGKCPSITSASAERAQLLQTVTVNKKTATIDPRQQYSKSRDLIWFETLGSVVLVLGGKMIHLVVLWWIKANLGLDMPLMNIQPNLDQILFPIF
jgi:hypothetical protein